MKLSAPKARSIRIWFLKSCVALQLAWEIRLSCHLRYELQFCAKQTRKRDEIRAHLFRSCFHRVTGITHKGGGVCPPVGPPPPARPPSYLVFYVLLTVHLDAVLGNDQLDALFLNVFILCLYMFRAASAYHQEG
jgi:hypothetical protein